jgi:hypothetical protein
VAAKGRFARSGVRKRRADDRHQLARQSKHALISAIEAGAAPPAIEDGVFLPTTCASTTIRWSFVWLMSRRRRVTVSAIAAAWSELIGHGEF